MPWIVDDAGRLWVDLPARKERRQPKPRRFAGIKVGDQIERAQVTKGWLGGRDDPTKPAVEMFRRIEYYVVTDVWFDPVAGQDNPAKGEMVAIQRIGPDGIPKYRKMAHSKLGLASNGFHYAAINYIELCQTCTTAMKDGDCVVGIGHARTIRARPKVPNPRF